MTNSQWMLAAGLAAVEVLLLLPLLRRPPADKRRWSGERVYTVVLAHVLGAALFFAGGYTQASHGWFSGNAARWKQLPTPFESFTASGDPSLARQVGAVERRAPRPELGSAQGVARWQREMRSYLDSAVIGARAGDGAAPPVHRVLGTAKLPGGVTRSFVAVPGFDGTPLPGYLFVPPGTGRRPAVLVISGHGNGIIETAGLTPSYQHEAALRLARAGYVTFTPELRGFGYLGLRIGNEHLTTANNALMAGRSYKAFLLRDLRGMVDWLQAQPAVDPERMGVTGVSFGGEMSVALAAVDPRLRVVVAQGTEGGVGPHDGYHRDANPGFPHVLCHFFDTPNRHVAREDPFLLVAPRPMLLVRGTEEGPENAAFLALLRSAYRRFGPDARFVDRTVPGGHEYFADPAIAFFREHL
ncbi:MAG: dienelactone hydrolase family protein [Longimicrobiaceae bacterium]